MGGSLLSFLFTLAGALEQARWGLGVPAHLAVRTSAASSSGSTCMGVCAVQASRGPGLTAVPPPFSAGSTSSSLCEHWVSRLPGSKPASATSAASSRRTSLASLSESVEMTGERSEDDGECVFWKHTSKRQLTDSTGPSCLGTKSQEGCGWCCIVFRPSVRVM